MPKPSPVNAVIQIVPAQTLDHVAVVRELFREYACEIEVDLCFQGFEQELATLPGRYAPPEGWLLLAMGSDAIASGCVALRNLGQGICEMKRLYVRPAFRGNGAGRLLAIAIVSAAREIGYRAMTLDTLSSMREALALYASLGFRRVEPYYTNPCGNAVFLELPLHKPGLGTADA